MAVKASTYYLSHDRYDSLDPPNSLADIRFKSLQPRSASHPNVLINSPLIFELYNYRSKRLLGGRVSHVAHAGGRNYETVRVGVSEMQARCRARIVPKRQSAGTFSVDKETISSAFPLLLNLCRPIGV